MRTFDPDIEDQLDDGRIDRRDALVFILEEGTFGFFANGTGTLTWNIEGVDVDFVGAGSLIKMEVSETDMQQTQNTIEVTLASRYEVDGEVVELISADALQSIEAMNWYRRPAIVGRFWINEAGQVIDFEQRARCEIHEIVHDEDETSGAVLVGRLNTLDVFRKLVDAKTRNNELQKLIDPDDRGLDAVSKMTTEKVYWGRRDPGAL